MVQLSKFRSRKVSSEEPIQEKLKKKKTLATRRKIKEEPKKFQKLSTACRKKPKYTLSTSKKVSNGFSWKGFKIMSEPKSVSDLYNIQKILRRYDLSVEDRPSIGQKRGLKRYQPVLTYVVETYIQPGYTSFY